MKISHILRGLVILICLSSCSKELLLFPANSGGYGNPDKSESSGSTTPAANLQASAGEVIFVATSEENQLAIPPEATSLKQNSAARIKQPVTNELLTLKQGAAEPGYQKRSVVYYPQASIQKQSTAANTRVPETKFRDNLFSILSFSCAMLGILIILLGSGIGIFLGLPAIIFGIMGLSKKEEFKSLALAGLILGILKVVLLIIVAATLRPGK